MKKLYLLLFLLLASSSLMAEFKRDISKKEVFSDLQLISLMDLGVGESAYIEAYDVICINKSNQLGIPKEITVVTDRSDYDFYYKVTILPKQRVSMRVIPREGEKDKNSLKHLLYSLVIPAQCKNFKEYGLISSEEVYVLENIEGVSSLSELLGIYTGR